MSHKRLSRTNQKCPEKRDLWEHEDISVYSHHHRTHDVRKNSCSSR
jgi:hypothetical protein